MLASVTPFTASLKGYAINYTADLWDSNENHTDWLASENRKKVTHGGFKNLMHDMRNALQE